MMRSHDNTAKAGKATKKTTKKVIKKSKCKELHTTLIGVQNHQKPLENCPFPSGLF